ncbi:MAG: hypothetical protein NC299_18185 [Lachnospiraceae bacterium]|nr:hypothetical protein [Ruminococcus sp.]MCM1277258.1 hypothetical protein [Lachnospiraceae bacterium]
MTNSDKCLYWERIYQVINGNKCHILTKLKYGVIPENQRLEYKSFDDVWQKKFGLQCSYNERKRIFGKGKIRVLYYATNYGYKKLTESNFGSAYIEIEYKEGSTGYTTQYLAKELPSEMFFDYCRDNLQKGEISNE